MWKQVAREWIGFRSVRRNGVPLNGSISATFLAEKKGAPSASISELRSFDTISTFTIPARDFCCLILDLRDLTGPGGRRTLDIMYLS
jgi:hypothetical protein